MMPKAVTFFGYWSGDLPEVTELHFRSFLHYHPHSNYDLWLDIDTASNLPSKMDWLAHHPQIHLRYFSLQALCLASTILSGSRQLPWPVLVEKWATFLSSVFFDNCLLRFQ